MMRAMTAFCAVATAFVCCPPAAHGRDVGRARGASPEGASTARGAASGRHDGRSVHVTLGVQGDALLRPSRRARHDEPHGAAAPSSRLDVPSHLGRGPTPSATPKPESEPKTAKKAERPSERSTAADPDPILRFEATASEAVSAVHGRSKPALVLEKGSASLDGAGGRAKKHGKVRRARPVPPNASWRSYRHEPWRRGYVSLFGHGKRWSGYVVGPDGEVPSLSRKSLSAALASWRTGRQLLVDERLISLIADVSDEFGGRPIRIVSGYREHSYAPDSKHKIGQAFDFSVPGVPNEALRDFLRSMPDVGVGYYPNSTHVHLDVRDKSTYWVDYSAPGEHPLYAYERRVRGMTPRERAIATALDALTSHREALGAPSTSLPSPAPRWGAGAEDPRAGAGVARPSRSAALPSGEPPASTAFGLAPDAGAPRESARAAALIDGGAGRAAPSLAATPLAATQGLRADRFPMPVRDAWASPLAPGRARAVRSADAEGWAGSG